MNNTIFDSFIKGGLAALWGFISSGFSTESAIRAGVASLLEDFTKVLPREIRESFISQATLAIVAAKDRDHAELEFTAVLADIAEAVKKL